MSQEIRIRVAAAGDEGILASLSAVVHELHVGQRPDVFKPTDLRGLEDWFLQTLKAASAKIWIAELGNLPVGYALVTPSGVPRTCFAMKDAGMRSTKLEYTPITDGKVLRAVCFATSSSPRARTGCRTSSSTPGPSTKLLATRSSDWASCRGMCDLNDEGDLHSGRRPTWR